MQKKRVGNLRLDKKKALGGDQFQPTAPPPQHNCAGEFWIVLRVHSLERTMELFTRFLTSEQFWHVR